MPNPLHSIFGLRDNGLPLVFLAPIAGYSNSPMRRISHRHGAAVSYTEMASVKGLLNSEENKTWGLLETTKNEGPVVAHLFGTEPEEFAEAAVKIEQLKRFVAIDLNAGCPARKITEQGAGSELIKQPQRIHDIIAAMKKVVRLPITVKTRLGPEPGKVMIYEILAAAESAGAAALTLHGRFTSQTQRGEVDLRLMGEAKRRAKIPVIGNGDVHSCYSAWNMFEETGVDAIMIARAAIGNPWIFETLRAMFASQIKPVHHPRTYVRPRRDLRQIEDVAEAHLDFQHKHIQLLHEKYNTPPSAEEIEGVVAATMRCHLFRYLHSLNGAAGIRKRIGEASTLDAVRDALKTCLMREETYRAKGLAKEGEKTTAEVIVEAP